MLAGDRPAMGLTRRSRGHRVEIQLLRRVCVANSAVEVHRSAPLCPDAIGGLRSLCEEARCNERVLAQPRLSLVQPQGDGVHRAAENLCCLGVAAPLPIDEPQRLAVKIGETLKPAIALRLRQSERDPPVEGAKNHPMMPLVWLRNYTGESGKTSKICSRFSNRSRRRW